MTDITALKKSLSRRGQRPALDTSGEPMLTRVTNLPGIVFISAEQLVDELAKRGKVIDQESLVISEGTPTPAAAPQPPSINPPTIPKEKKEKKEKGDNAIPTPQPPISPCWAKEELEAMKYNDLRKLAALWPDVHGNKGKDHILEALTGKPKIAPPRTE